MPAFNLCIMVGNLTRDVQLTYTPNQTPVSDFGLAVNRKWTGSDGAAHEEVCFLDVRAFGKLAEIVNKYMHKGDALLVQGYLKFETWTGKDAEQTKHSKHRLVAEKVQFLGQPKTASAGDHSTVPDSDIPF
jgi:single-strand DNA-binding protein